MNFLIKMKRWRVSVDILCYKFATQTLDGDNCAKATQHESCYDYFDRLRGKFKKENKNFLIHKLRKVVNILQISRRVPWPVE